MLSLIPLTSMGTECRLHKVDCPHFASVGWSTACPGRMLRQDLVAHLKDPSTLKAAVENLPRQVAEDRLTMAVLRTENGALQTDNYGLNIKL